jgi:D-alanine-D-alanine ligase
MIDASVAARMQEHALAFHAAIGARDYSRIDVMMDADGSLQLLECNTLPGLTRLSLFPESAAAAGISYEALVDRLVRAALARSGVRAS